VSSSEATLPGRLGLRRRAPMLYRRLMRGFYPGVASPASSLPQIESDAELNMDRSIPGPSALGLGKETGGAAELSAQSGKHSRQKHVPKVTGSFDHPVLPNPPVY
jgi:hypothetical protein